MDKKTGFTALFLALCFLATAPAPLFSFPDDAIEVAKKKQEIAIQKREADIREGLREAIRLANISSTRAAEHLKPILADLEADEIIPPTRRDSLVRQVRNQIKQYEGDAARTTSRNENSIQTRAEAQARQSALDAKAREAETISRSIDSINKLRRDKNYEEANRRFSELSRKFPNNPAVSGLGTINRNQENISAEANLLAQRANATLALQREMLRSTIPISGEITFPDDWVERSKRRLPSAKISDEDKKILKTMSSPISITLKNDPFQAFIDYMEKHFGQAFIIDQQALQLANVNGDSQVSVNAKGWSTRTVLRKVLSDLGLSYYVKDRSIYITSPDRAKETMTTKAYPIGDILGILNLQAPPNYSQLPLYQQMMIQNQIAFNQMVFVQSVQNIISTVKAIDPQSWQPEGNGSIVFEPATMSLIIRQSAEFHFMVGSGIR